MTGQTHYSMHTDVKFRPLELIDVRRRQNENREQWFNQTLTMRTPDRRSERTAPSRRSYVPILEGSQ